MIAFILFLVFYQFLYFVPLMIVLAFVNYLLPADNLAEYPVIALVAFVVILFAFVSASRRAQLAAQVFAGGAMSFGEAHSFSGGALRVELSLLPIIGRFFRPRDKDGSL